MPFEGEYASNKPLTRIANNPRVREVVSRCRRREPGPDEPAGPQLVVAPVTSSGYLPNLLVAVDGSYHQHAVENGFPGAELAYVTVASVLVDLKRQRELDKRRPVNPGALSATQEADTIEAVLPGCNMLFEDDLSPRHSFRRLFYDGCRETSFLSESLLETYEALLAYKTAEAQRCPYGDCPGRGAYPAEGAYRPAPGTYECPCAERRPLYATDALRMHEGLNLTGPSGAMFQEAMQVWERLSVINAIRALTADKDNVKVLRNMAFVLDGPLAMFGHPAWLAPAIRKELARLNARVLKATGRDLLIIGVEKTGAFVEHFDRIDRSPDPRDRRPVYPPGTALLVSGPYVRRHVVVGEKQYGKDTYFGRKFFYKTASGARLVASLPYLRDSDGDWSTADPDQYPRLADAMSVLDAVFSSRYPNAVAPLVAAHAEAAIPMNVGKRVLERLTQELMQKA